MNVKAIRLVFSEEELFEESKEFCFLNSVKHRNVLFLTVKVVLVGCDLGPLAVEIFRKILILL